MKNKQGILQYIVTVVSAEYNKDNHKWLYTLKDYRSQPIPGRVAETELE